MIDTLYATRQKRLDVTKEVDALKVEEAQMRERILEMLDEQGMAKASGYMATCGIKKSIEPVTTDWEQIHEFIRIENRFDLIQKRLSAPAWRDLFNTGILVPGTDSVEVRDLSLTKSTRG
jgi:hypothetical protein